MQEILTQTSAKSKVRRTNSFTATQRLDESVYTSVDSLVNTVVHTTATVHRAATVSDEEASNNCKKRRDAKSRATKSPANPQPHCGPISETNEQSADSCAENSANETTPEEKLDRMGKRLEKQVALEVERLKTLTDLFDDVYQYNCHALLENASSTGGQRSSDENSSNVRSRRGAKCKGTSSGISSISPLRSSSQQSPIRSISSQQPSIGSSDRASLPKPRRRCLFPTVKTELAKTPPQTSSVFCAIPPFKSPQTPSKKLYNSPKTSNMRDLLDIWESRCSYADTTKTPASASKRDSCSISSSTGNTLVRQMKRLFDKVPPTEETPKLVASTPIIRQPAQPQRRLKRQAPLPPNMLETPLRQQCADADVPVQFMTPAWGSVTAESPAQPPTKPLRRRDLKIRPLQMLDEEPLPQMPNATSTLNRPTMITVTNLAKPPPVALDANATVDMSTHSGNVRHIIDMFNEMSGCSSHASTLTRKIPILPPDSPKTTEQPADSESSAASSPKTFAKIRNNIDSFFKQHVDLQPTAKTLATPKSSNQSPRRPHKLAVHFDIVLTVHDIPSIVLEEHPHIRRPTPTSFDYCVDKPTNRRNCTCSKCSSNTIKRLLSGNAEHILKAQRALDDRPSIGSQRFATIDDYRSYQHDRFARDQQKLSPLRDFLQLTADQDGDDIDANAEPLRSAKRKQRTPALQTIAEGDAAKHTMTNEEMDMKRKRKLPADEYDGHRKRAMRISIEWNHKDATHNKSLGSNVFLSEFNINLNVPDYNSFERDLNASQPKPRDVLTVEVAPEAEADVADEIAVQDDPEHVPETDSLFADDVDDEDGDAEELPPALAPKLRISRKIPTNATSFERALQEKFQVLRGTSLAVNSSCSGSGSNWLLNAESVSNLAEGVSTSPLPAIRSVTLQSQAQKRTASIVGTIPKTKRTETPAAAAARCASSRINNTPNDRGARAAVAAFQPRQQQYHSHKRADGIDRYNDLHDLQQFMASSSFRSKCNEACTDLGKALCHDQSKAPDVKEGSLYKYIERLKVNTLIEYFKAKPTAAETAKQNKRRSCLF